MNTENIKKKIDYLMIELKEKIGVSDEDISELKKILDLSDFSDNN